MTLCVYNFVYIGSQTISAETHTYEKRPMPKNIRHKTPRETDTYEKMPMPKEVCHQAPIHLRRDICKKKCPKTRIQECDFFA